MKQQKNLKEIFIQELFSSYLLFILFVPIPSTTYFGWFQHFISSLIFDIPQGVANPAVLYGLWILGDISSSELTVRLLANLLAVFFGYHLVQLLFPFHDLTGPTLHTNNENGFCVEFLLGFFLMLIIAFSSKFKQFVPALVAIGVRGLLILEGGKYTGASMNPLFASGWEIFRDYSSVQLHCLSDQIYHCVNFISIYVLAPILGSCLAALILRLSAWENSNQGEKGQRKPPFKSSTSNMTNLKDKIE